MSSSPTLKLDWCSHQAAKYAVESWHYSRRQPLGAMVKIGVWENDNFIGCVLFARGNTPTLGNPYGLTMYECCELARVALADHSAQTSKIVSIALKFLQKHCPGIRLVVSFADPEQGHHGGIYQAGNWIYCGQTAPFWQWFHAGRWKHNREVTSGAFGRGRKVKVYSELPKQLLLGKFRYLMPLDDAMREKVKSLAKPYPKREQSADSIRNANKVQTAARRFTPQAAAQVRPVRSN